MEKLVRENPDFSLCGLNCCLCPRFNADGKSKCPGCGGEGFSEQHPTCAVATCNRKHDNVEYCFECSSYPCTKYENESTCDSFISYRSVRQNLGEAKSDIDTYLENLRKRYELLQILLARYNDGRSKGLYCLVANDMPMDDLESILDMAGKLSTEMTVQEKAKLIKERIAQIGKKFGIEYVLRKKGA